MGTNAPSGRSTAMRIRRCGGGASDALASWFCHLDPPLKRKALIRMTEMILPLTNDDLICIETAHLEFKADFPKNAHGIAKEIAAFASTKGGRIVIGIGDDRSVIGVPSAKSDEGKQEFIERIEGICGQSIQPPCGVSVSFQVFKGQTIALIHVREGTEGMYYAGGKPYIRAMSISRPATPQEVREKILISDLRQRLEILEQAATPSQSVAAGIMGQGELATKNMSDIMKELARRERRRFP